MKFIAITPARYESNRFPGKALVNVRGKTMILRVYEQAAKSSLFAAVHVATDSQAIFDSITENGGNAVMTSSQCSSGTDRVAEAARILQLDEHDIVVNIQGDQPVLQPDCLHDLIAPFSTISGLNMATLATPITTTVDRHDPNTVKVIFDNSGKAIYFSRFSIPYNRDDKTDIPYYKHLGIYAYSNIFLQKITQLPPSRLEEAEKLEQLRVLENGYTIQVSVTQHDSPSVDDPADLKKLEAFL